MSDSYELFRVRMRLFLVKQKLACKSFRTILIEVFELYVKVSVH